MCDEIDKMYYMIMD